MYLEYHRATLTTQARTKQLNRKAELALVAVGVFLVMDTNATLADIGTKRQLIAEIMAGLSGQGAVAHAFLANQLMLAATAMAVPSPWRALTSLATVSHAS